MPRGDNKIFGDAQLAWKPMANNKALKGRSDIF